MRQPALGFQGRHAPHSCGSDCLPVVVVHDIAGSENSGHTRLGAQRFCFYVAVRCELKLPTEELRIRRMPNCEKQPAHVEILLCTRNRVLDAQPGYMIIAEYFDHAAVP